MANSETEQTLPWLQEGAKDAAHVAEGAHESHEGHVASVEHHPKKAGMPQLDPTWFASQLFWLFVCFTVLYIIMARGIVPRIREVLESRQSRIESDLEFARSMQEEAETVKHEYEASLETSQNKARQLIHSAQLQSEERAAATSKEIDADIQALTDASEAEIDKQAKQVEKDILPAIEELTCMVVERIMFKAPNADLVQKTVKAELKNLSLTKA